MAVCRKDVNLRHPVGQCPYVDAPVEESGKRMTREEFTGHVAQLVAGLQVLVSLRGNPAVLGAAGPAWQALCDEVTGGFGWTTAERCAEVFTEILEKPRVEIRTCTCGHPRLAHCQGTVDVGCFRCSCWGFEED